MRCVCPITVDVGACVCVYVCAVCLVVNMHYWSLKIHDVTCVDNSHSTKARSGQRDNITGEREM